ncbi:Ferrichrome outer membrane transporter/phage receptor [Methylobacterium crusticola]|uniref:Ferrichrome outer membrane transporter/phage receptor n=1 Tax=Methylobacterium crusticola TaxID=1697972 RepID=A0ABQ4QYF4_9HYPH|nr:TonB-dependent siderophore receptor [Methylobacterium crusticola]GJD49597.1 Ferrichrome outer membrane transporter/phage receptor [Methylobacterium crusticola]
MRVGKSQYLFSPRSAASRLGLAGASLLTLAVAAAAQDATPPRRGIASPPAEATVQLDEITVEGRGGGALPPSAAAAAVRTVESPTGPVNGFVATRSATATKTNTPLIETPQSISVVGREQIDAQKAQTLTQATQYVPGLYSGTFGADSRIDYFTLRGFVASDYGIYRDGLQLLNYGFAYFRVDTFGLERIEVLRGPAAVLFGAGNPGGLINQVTKRPTLDPLRYVEVGGGAFGQGGFGYAAFDLGGPADADGHWFYRLTGIGRTGGTQVEGAPEDRVYIAPAFTYKPDGATKLTVLSSYQHDNAAVTANFLPYSGTVRPNLSGLRIPRSLNVGDADLNTFRRDQAYVGYEFEHAFDETWTVRQNLRYSFVESFQNSYIGQIGYSDAAETRLARYQFRDSARANLFQVDNQAEARFSDGFFRHDLLLGLDYKNYQLHDNQASTFPGPSLSILFPVYGQRVAAPTPYLVNADSFEQLGLYAQDQIKITDRLTLLLGGRQDFADNRVRDLLTPGNSNGRSDNAFTYRTALIYNFDFGLAPYVTYATSFQPQIGTDVNGQSFRPETGDQIEGGVKFEPPGAGYFVTLAGFDLRRSNVLTANPANTLFQTQIGEVRSTGFEASLTATLAEGLNAVAAYTVFGLTTEKGTPEQLGRVPVNIPENLASLFVDYTIPFGDWKGFGFGGGVRYIGRSFADVANTVRVPDYVLFDAQVHYNYENWRIALNATNIADRRFVSSCQAINSCFYGDARRVVASLSYKW